MAEDLELQEPVCDTPLLEKYGETKTQLAMSSMFSSELLASVC